MDLLGRDERERASQPHVSGGSAVMATGAGGDRFLVADHLGTTLATLDAATPDSADAVLLASLGTGAASETDSSVRFTGKPYDPDLDAFVFPFRNFNPETGTWLSADPAGFPDGPNQHFYAPVPTTGLDPLGLETQPLYETHTASGLLIRQIYSRHHFIVRMSSRLVLWS